MKYLKKFNTAEEYAAFLESGEMVRPNVSYVAESDEISYFPLGSIITLNQNLTDPALIISGSINGSHIQKIRQNSHRYLGKYTEDGKMTICQLDDADSTRYADGSSAILTGEEGDVFMKLPAFSYRSTEVEPNVWNIEFMYGKAIDDSWQQWDGNDLIGVYEASINGNKAHSRSNVASTDQVTQSSFKACAEAKGTGFSLVKWKHHSMIAFLFYAMYGNTNAQALIGAGGAGTNVTGLTNALGMTDTSAVASGESINFWGLENWWGNKREWIDNVRVASSTEWTVTEDDGSTRTMNVTSSSGFITKILVGEHLDVAPAAVSGSGTTGFCDNYASGSSGNVLRRSNDGYHENGGVSHINASNKNSYAGSNYGSRIAFRGTIEEVKNVETFKSLTVI